MNLVCASPKSDSCSNGPTNGQPPDADDNDDDNDVEQCVPFNLSRYPDGANGSRYMSQGKMRVALVLKIRRYAHGRLAQIEYKIKQF